MRLKLYTAKTMTKAMELMRAEMGSEAVVLSASEENGQAEVRAACERALPKEPKVASKRSGNVTSVTSGAIRSHIQNVLTWHDMPPGFIETIANAGLRDKAASHDPQSALSVGLRTTINCTPLEPQPGCPIFLFGPPGAGKTSVAARLARHIGGHPKLISADFRNSGDIARLRAYSGRALVTSARTPERLLHIVEKCNHQTQNAIIDGPAINPIDPKQMHWLGEMIEALAVEPVLVLSAEGQREEMEESARAFAALGAGQVIVTRLDLVRRLGGWISAISLARLSLAQLSLSSVRSKALIAAHHGRLSRLLLETAPMAPVMATSETQPLKGAA